MIAEDNFQEAVDKLCDEVSGGRTSIEMGEWEDKTDRYQVEIANWSLAQSIQTAKARRNILETVKDCLDSMTWNQNNGNLNGTFSEEVFNGHVALQDI